MIKKYLYLISFTIIFVFSKCSPDASEKYKSYERNPEYMEDLTSAEKDYYNAYNQVMDLWNVSYDDLYIPTSFGTAHVIVSGAANKPPLVLLHGMNASSAMWYPNIETLSESFQVFAIDLITEPGKSNASQKIENTETIIKWYDEVFKKLQLQHFQIIGASRGGWLAVKLALAYPEKIKSMVLLSPAQTFIWIQPGTALFSNIIFEIAPTEKRLAKVLDKMSARVDKISPAFKDLFYQATKRSSLDDILLEMQPFSDDTLQSINMPVMLLIGDEDIINNERSIEIARENITNLEARIISDAGHFLSFDQADRVNELMVSFLQK